jgi:hypothetical protein
VVVVWEEEAVLVVVGAPPSRRAGASVLLRRGLLLRELGVGVVVFVWVVAVAVVVVMVGVMLLTSGSEPAPFCSALTVSGASGMLVLRSLAAVSCWLASCFGFSEELGGGNWEGRRQLRLPA